ncbi:DUF2306 domain-containing protein [Massilia endophytica]|uniref:hypothetical protein n=1 Tax=Massilia endophytica TaxID=2899220 RepID=UPI001E3800D8|nr:hypothetical protein [Massilia endophytica]UGQ46658.1 hypothetical protein LSQ66_23305 [Massilia endophytica]
MLFGLSQLGVFHTAISLVAVASGAAALWRDRRITSRNSLGRIYVVTTLVTCVSALGIFAHGGFGPPHIFALVTLATLLLAFGAERLGMFGRKAAYVATIGYSATFFFSLIPGITETSTRLPLGNPLLASPEAPALKTAYLVLLVLFLVGAVLQAKMIRALHNS